MASYNNRDKRLSNFNKTFSKDLDDTNRRQKIHIKQSLSIQFDYELAQAEECARSEDMIGAYMHKIKADLINNMLNSE
jgi:hypothetical protein